MKRMKRVCHYVVGYEPEPAGSDVADPRIRCGEEATVRVDDEEWLCPKHAALVREGRVSNRSTAR